MQSKRVLSIILGICLIPRIVIGQPIMKGPNLGGVTPAVGGGGGGGLATTDIDTSAELAAILTDETGTGSVVFSTSPTLVTPVLGVATATSINKVTITPPATAATLTIANNKTLTISNTITATATDGSTVSFGTGGTVAYTSSDLSQFAATTSAQLAALLTNETGTGVVVFSNSPSLTSPTMTTPNIGVATATSVNKVTITPPATSATITVADGKTLTMNNSITFSGTDGASVSFGTGGTVAYTAGNLSQFAATTSAQLAGVLSNETGSGLAVFDTSPTLSGVTLNGTTTASVINADTSVSVAPSSSVANLLRVFENQTNLTPDPTCANAGTLDYITLIDKDETNDVYDWVLCNGTNELLDLTTLPATVAAKANTGDLLSSSSVVRTDADSSISLAYEVPWGNSSRKSLSCWDDMLRAPSGTGECTFTTSTGNGGTTTQTTASTFPNLLGVFSLTHDGSTASSYSVLITQHTNVFHPGATTYRKQFIGSVALSAAPVNGQDFITRIGFINSSNSATPTGGVYFETDFATRAGNWYAVTNNGGGGSVTATNTTTAAVGANTFVRFEIDCNAAGTSCDFTINGGTPTTIATNIPTAANASGIGVQLVRTSGTSKTVYIDYAGFKATYASAR